MKLKNLKVGQSLVLAELSSRKIRDLIMRFFKLPTSHRKHWGYKTEDFEVEYYNEGKNYFSIMFESRGDHKASLVIFKEMLSALKSFAAKNNIKFSTGKYSAKGVPVIRPTLKSYKGGKNSAGEKIPASHRLDITISQK